MDFKTYFDFADNQKIMDIAYSVFPGIPGNSEIHFKEAIRNGYHGMKADMQLSKDGKIILCHDDGYTFDENGMITSFAPDKFTAIHDLTAGEINDLRFAQAWGGEHHRPCQLETMLQLCRDHNRFAYLTLRDDPWRPEVVARMVELLRQYEMTGRTVVNFYPPQPGAVQLIDSLCPGLKYCHTLVPNTPLSEQLIDDSAAGGYSIICLCGLTNGIFDKRLAERAEATGIHIWCWGLKTIEAISTAVKCGVTGFQMFMPSGTPDMLAQYFPSQIDLC